jgi:phosphate-selective porin
MLSRQADSSSIGINMISSDFRYQLKNFEARGEFIWMNLKNTNEYNAITDQDLGQTAYGYYAEVGYNIGSIFNLKNKLVPFIRYSNYDTHHKVSTNQIRNLNYNNEVITTGISCFLNPNFVVKADYQKQKNGKNIASNTFNAGVGYWFR